jgi:DNA-binding transcriptional regulator YhcF (GntR family)
MNNLSASNPAIQKAADYIKANLANQAWQPGEKLPSSLVLAKSAGVSPVTMLRAIAILKADGLVHGVKRGPIRAGGHIIQRPPSASQETSICQAKRILLEKDILAGAFAREGRLPSFKELQTRYGACFRTIRKILHAMAADGVVRMRGRTYEFPGISSRGHSRRIVFLTRQVQTPPRSALNQGQYRIFDLLEQECIRRELKLDLADFDLALAEPSSRSQAEASILGPALGYILDFQWYDAGEIRRMCFDILARISVFKCPVAILDENGDFDLPAPFISNPLIQVFRIEGKKAGSRIARLLLGLGHRSVVFVSSNHGAPWSRQRLEGITDQYSKAGCGGGVHQVVGEKLSINRQYALAVSGLNTGLIRRMLAVGLSHPDANEEFRRFLYIKKNLPPEAFSQEDVRWIRQKFGIISDLAKRNPGKDLFDRIGEDVLAEIGTRFSLAVRVPLFEQALKQYPNATAWICATDGIAMMALPFLHDRGIDVPRDMSVVGFDNQPISALERRLTSFDFNAHGFIHHMLNFISRPPMPRGRYRHSPVEVEGIVVQRETAGPPAGKSGR